MRSAVDRCAVAAPRGRASPSGDSVPRAGPASSRRRPTSCASWTATAPSTGADLAARRGTGRRRRCGPRRSARVGRLRGAWPLHARSANRALAFELRRRTRHPAHRPRTRCARRAGEAARALGIAIAGSVGRWRWCCARGEAGWRIDEVDGRLRASHRTSKVTGTVAGTLAAVHDMAACCDEHGDDTLIVIAKSPEAGPGEDAPVPAVHAPTRPPLLAEAALADTLDAVGAATLGAPARPRARRSARSVAPGRLRGRSRSARAVSTHGSRACSHDAGGPAFLVGMDTPQLTGELVDAMLSELSAADV